MASVADRMAGSRAAAIPLRRRRRSRDDVELLIRSAARQLFAERGYAATTTREIARLADVSETLVFRYYGDKARLFETVVTQPFNDLMQGVSVQRPGADQRMTATAVYAAVFDLLDQNRQLLSAAFAGPPPDKDEPATDMPRLEPFFRAAIGRLREEYREAGGEPQFDIDLGLRLAFGMMASAVLMRGWLFPDGPQEKHHIVHVLQTMVDKALSPPPRS